jgi:Icc-related predicted phosphoesterase
MKIQIASDLHLEFLEQQFPDYRIVEPADADVLVLAGDIHRQSRAIDTFSDWPVPVIYVHGNHEGYGTDFATLIPEMRAGARHANVHYLENDEFILNGVRFLGCCLWTDYSLRGEESREAAMQEAVRCIKDHEAIYNTAGNYFTPQDAFRIHTASRTWLTRKLDQPHDGPTVVVTHHAPHPGSVHPRYAGDIVNTAFVTDLTPLLSKATLWIHGHVHDSFDYRVDQARVVANPRGYARNRRGAATPGDLVWENPGFDAGLVVEV